MAEISQVQGDQVGGDDLHAEWVVLSLCDALAAYMQYDTSTPAPVRGRFADLLPYARKGDDPAKGQRARFKWEMGRGLLDSIGYVLPRSPDARPVLIPAEVWDKGQIDWDCAEVFGAGFHFVNVRVLITVSNYGRWGLPYFVEALPALGAFPPSEARRARLSLPVAQDDPDNMSADATGSGVSHPSGGADVGPPLTKPPANPRGRPSKKDVITAAYHAIEKVPNQLNKKLVEAIFDHIKANYPEIDSKGLSDQTILRVVRSLKPR